MAAKGQKLKAQITQKILDTFEGSFINGEIDMLSVDGEWEANNNLVLDMIGAF